MNNARKPHYPEIRRAENRQYKKRPTLPVIGSFRNDKDKERIQPCWKKSCRDDKLAACSRVLPFITTRLMRDLQFYISVAGFLACH